MTARLYFHRFARDATPVGTLPNGHVVYHLTTNKGQTDYHVRRRAKSPKAKGYTQATELTGVESTTVQWDCKQAQARAAMWLQANAQAHRRRIDRSQRYAADQKAELDAMLARRGTTWNSSVRRECRLPADVEPELTDFGVIRLKGEARWLPNGEWHATTWVFDAPTRHLEKRLKWLREAELFEKHAKRLRVEVTDGK